jgi:hypothetical protein
MTRQSAETIEEITDAQLYRAMCTASREGRLNPIDAAILNLPTGSERCRMCGMLAPDPESAIACCTTPDRLGGGAPGQRMTSYTGMIVDRMRFVAALEGLMITSDLGWPADYGVSRDAMRNLKNRVKTNSTQWLADETWTRLVRIFNGKVPGCAEITRGGVERSGNREVA